MIRMTDHFFRWGTQHHFHFMRDHPAHFIEVWTGEKEKQLWVFARGTKIFWLILLTIFLYARPSCSLYWGAHETKRSKSSFAWNISESILISAFNQVLGSGWGVRLGPAKSKVFTFQDLIALIIVRMVIIMTIISMAMTIMLVCCPTR